jgi:hypothetical protein
VSFQYKPKNTQIRAYVDENTDSIITNLAEATGNSKGLVIERLLKESSTFRDALKIQKESKEKHLEELKRSIKL